MKHEPSRVKSCPDCDGENEDCPTCEGCGEVYYFTADELVEIDTRLKAFEGGRLTGEQSKRFVSFALKAIALRPTPTSW